MKCSAQPCLMHKSEKEPGWMNCFLPAGTGNYADTLGDCALLQCRFFNGRARNEDIAYNVDIAR